MSDQRRALILLAMGILFMASLSWLLRKDTQQAMRTAKYMAVHHCTNIGMSGDLAGPAHAMYKCTTGIFTKADIQRESNNE